MKFTIFFSLSFLVFFSLSCEQNDTNLEVSYEEGVAFTLAFGETASCTCGAPDITFTEMVTDSRCPLNVTCVWEGEVIVKTQFGGEELQLGLSPIDTAPSADTVGQWSVTLLEVTPHPVEGEVIPDEDYELKLLVEAI